MADLREILRDLERLDLRGKSTSDSALHIQASHYHHHAASSQYSYSVKHSEKSDSVLEDSDSDAHSLLNLGFGLASLILFAVIAWLLLHAECPLDSEKLSGNDTIEHIHPPIPNEGGRGKVTWGQSSENLVLNHTLITDREVTLGDEHEDALEHEYVWQQLAINYGMPGIRNGGLRAVDKGEFAAPKARSTSALEAVSSARRMKWPVRFMDVPASSSESVEEYRDRQRQRTCSFWLEPLSTMQPAAMPPSDVGGGPVRRLSATEAMGSSMRLITYNTRRLRAPDGRCSATAVGDALASLQPTLVALNEVDLKLCPTALTSIAERLGGFYVAFFGHVQGHYGNALLSKYPIAAVRRTHLRGGTEVNLLPGTKKWDGEIAQEGDVHRIGRGLLECDIQLPATADGGEKRLTVAVSHLDHIAEEQRQIQLAHILDTLQPNAGQALLVGDFNALTRSDYQDHEWAALENRNFCKKWAPPQSGCLDSLLAAGFVDAFAESRGRGPLSARANAADDPIFSAHVGHPVDRIDYCFVAAKAGIAVRRATVLTQVVFSDHFPVSFDLEY